ncbi:MAG TPA: PA14 domain-containing protein, partial [Planctomycetota bacterium]|nr:PA14 domain-containing protein [Planctomycetota bacterium]
VAAFGTPPPAAQTAVPVRNGSSGTESTAPARKAWDEAEKLFADKQFPAAREAYLAFDRKFGSTPLRELNAGTLKDRLAVIEDELNPKPRPGLIGWYFSGRDFQDGNLLLERVDATVDFGWGGGAPAPEVPMDGFCVRWVGTLKIKQPGHYTLATVTDDGARLKVDDKLVLEQWVDQADTRVAGAVDLTAGDHAIAFEMYEAGGAATARLFWTLDNGFAEQIIPPEALSHDPKALKHPAARPALSPPNTPVDDPQNNNDDHF